MRKAVRPAIATVIWLLLPQIGHCFYNPSTGRWLSRDPTEESGGANVYGFVANDPVRRADELGLWSTDDHASLTWAGFYVFTHETPVQQDSACSGKVLVRLIRANIEQDHNIAHYLELRRHFNRLPGTGRERARQEYWDYLRKEESNFSRAAGRPSKANCKAAIKALGHLSHSWQDFFAHAIKFTGTGDGDWNAWVPSEPRDPGTPDSLESMHDLFPSSYPGEHPCLGEPNLATWEYFDRLNGALDFTKRKYRLYLPRLFRVCQCFCEE